MTKAEFVNYLKDKGFDALEDKEGCVLIVTEDKEDLDKLDELVKETGYIGIRGWRGVNYAKQTID